MDIEAGVLIPEALAGDDRVIAGHLPAGTYATLTHRDHSMRANKTQLQWCSESSIPLDVRRVPQGDHFGCRYELILSDVMAQPRKTQWVVQPGELAHGYATFSLQSRWSWLHSRIDHVNDNKVSPLGARLRGTLSLGSGRSLRDNAMQIKKGVGPALPPRPALRDTDVLPPSEHR
jgi:hypothetical protein